MRLRTIARRAARGGAGSPPVDPGDDFSDFTRFSSILPQLNPREDFTVMAGQKILFDVNMVDADALGTMRVQQGGKLYGDPTRELRFLADSLINQGGEVVFGRSDQTSKVWLHLCGDMKTVSGNSGGGPIKRGPTHDFNTDAPTGNNSLANDDFGVHRALINSMGGVMRLTGRTPVINTTLNGEYTGGTTLTVKPLPRSVSAGATIWVGHDGLYAGQAPDVRTITAFAAAGSTTLQISSAMADYRFGRDQWYTDSGIALAPGPFTLAGMRARASQDPFVPSAARVVISDTNFVLAGYDLPGASAWFANEGFGVHKMTMDANSISVTTNVNFDKQGQLGFLGRYGDHWHRTAFPNDDGTPSTLGVNGTPAFAPGNAVNQGCLFTNGRNRAVTLHACWGVQILGSTSIGGFGHQFFEEDGSEQDNTIADCFSMGMQEPPSQYQLKTHDTAQRGQETVTVGLAGFWFANPKNTHVRNFTSDTIGAPFGNAHPTGVSTDDVDRSAQAAGQYGCLGQSVNVPIMPGKGQMGIWEDNGGLSCGSHAFSAGGGNRNSGRQTFNYNLQITVDGRWDSPSIDNGMVLKRVKLVKCKGYRNTVASVSYENWTVCDTDSGNAISGVTGGGQMFGWIFIRESLNHESHVLNSTVQHAFMPYHNSINFFDGTAEGYNTEVFDILGSGVIPYLINKTSVMSSVTDYTNGLLVYPETNTNWKLRNSYGYFSTPAPHVTEDSNVWDSFYTSDPSKKLASNGNRNTGIGCLYDAYGYLSTGPSTPGRPNSWIVHKVPFHTYGLTDLQDVPGDIGSATTQTPFIGIKINTRDLGGNFSAGYPESAEIIFTRLDPSTMQKVTGAYWHQRQSGAGTNGIGFHHAVVPRNGWVLVEWPNLSPVNIFAGSVDVAGVIGRNGYDRPNSHVNPFYDHANDWFGIVLTNFSGTLAGTTLAWLSTYAKATSLSDLQSKKGGYFWVDEAADRCYMKLKVEATNTNPAGPADNNSFWRLQPA